MCWSQEGQGARWVHNTVSLAILTTTKAAIQATSLQFQKHPGDDMLSGIVGNHIQICFIY